MAGEGQPGGRLPGSIRLQEEREAAEPQVEDRAVRAVPFHRVKAAGQVVVSAVRAALFHGVKATGQAVVSAVRAVLFPGVKAAGQAEASAGREVSPGVNGRGGVYMRPGRAFQAPDLALEVENRVPHPPERLREVMGPAQELPG